jgi:ABC-type branched-subunit amino acid transport system substrate-binding protein
VGDLKLTTFGVLSPEDKLGRELAELFVREVEQRGGRVVARQSYAGSDTDFRRPIRLLQGLDPDAAEPEPPKGGAPLPPRPAPFQALFIPDAAERAGLIAPQLAYYGLENVQLLGTSGWNSLELIRRGGRFVEGALFVDGFFLDSPSPLVQDFVTRFAVRFGEEPSLLEAQGYDAAGILLTVLARPDVRSREDLRRALAEVRLYPGVTGAITIDAQGEVRRPLFLLQVRDGEIVQLNP